MMCFNIVFETEIGTRYRFWNLKVQSVQNVHYTTTRVGKLQCHAHVMPCFLVMRKYKRPLENIFCMIDMRLFSAYVICGVGK
jgi:hypothetical protein